VSLKARIATLEGIMSYHGIKGHVVISDESDGTCAEKLRLLGPDIFAKGGDRTADNMPQNEIDVCQEIGCRIVYGIGDLLNSSSKIMADSLKYEPHWVPRKSNEQYDIYDCRIADTVVSITYLKPHQSTSGHRHPHSELYVCIKGKGRLKTSALMKEQFAPGVHFNIPENIFHQVLNESNETIIFMCIWKGEDKT
jgi:quercetin dioxygenase-like cupin family protein